MVEVFSPLGHLVIEQEAGVILIRYSTSVAKSYDHLGALRRAKDEDLMCLVLPDAQR